MAAAAASITFEPIDTLSPVEHLGTEITELCSYIDAATYRPLVLIREFDEADRWAQAGLCSCAHWLDVKCGIGVNAAREKVRVVRALKNLPMIGAAFEKGTSSYSKVRAMARIADSENEDYLLLKGNHLGNRLGHPPTYCDYCHGNCAPRISLCADIRLSEAPSYARCKILV